MQNIKRYHFANVIAHIYRHLICIIPPTALQDYIILRMRKGEGLSFTTFLKDE